jgi:hypothetical protein
VLPMSENSPILEPKPTACVPMSGAADSQPPSTEVSCCYHPELKKWYPYDTTTGWDLTVECAGAPIAEAQEQPKA